MRVHVTFRWPCVCCMRARVYACVCMCVCVSVERERERASVCVRVCVCVERVWVDLLWDCVACINCGHTRNFCRRQMIKSKFEYWLWACMRSCVWVCGRACCCAYSSTHTRTFIWYIHSAHAHTQTGRWRWLWLRQWGYVNSWMIPSLPRNNTVLVGN